MAPPDPFPLAYIALLEAGLFVLEDSNVMDVLVGTEQRATSEGLSSVWFRGGYKTLVCN